MNPSAALPLARRAARYAKWMLANVPYMVRTGAPLSVHLRYFLTGLRRYPLERYAAQQAEFRDRGGRFIIPIPDLRIV